MVCLQLTLGEDESEIKTENRNKQEQGRGKIFQFGKKNNFLKLYTNSKWFGHRITTSHPKLWTYTEKLNELSFLLLAIPSCEPLQKN